MLKLGIGISASTTQLVRGVGYDSDDLTLVFNAHDRVLLKDYFNDNYRLAIIEFADGKQWNYSQINSLVNSRGVAADDGLLGLGEPADDHLAYHTGGDDYITVTSAQKTKYTGHSDETVHDNMAQPEYQATPYLGGVAECVTLSGVERLVHAMASFAPPVAGASSLPTHSQNKLVPLVVAH